MARSFRFYGKKRGHRRTGSNTLGSAGELLFFAVFLLLGCGGAVAVFVIWVVPEWRANYVYVENTCQVVSTKIEDKKTEDGFLYRPAIKVKHEVDGELYTTWSYYDVHKAFSSGTKEKRKILEREIRKDFPVYTEKKCWYDPDDPREVVLKRGFSWWIWPVFAIPASFVLIGSGGLVYRLLRWGKSAERRAVMVQRAQQRDPFNTNGGSQRRYPNVPGGADITNSPGTRLKFRLPISTSPGWALFGVAMICVFWNGIASMFVVFTVNGHLRGDPDWLLTLFVVPFVVGGILLIVRLIRQLLVTTGVGPTRVEISEHPLQPGKQCRLLVSQSGRLKVNSLSVLLVCEEEATYRQGTNTRTESRQVYQQEVFRREDFDIHRGMPFEAECELDVPAGAMHSFKADHNEVNWKLVVRGDVAGWPDYQRAFPVIVRPGNGKADA